MTGRLSSLLVNGCYYACCDCDSNETADMGLKMGWVEIRVTHLASPCPGPPAGLRLGALTQKRLTGIFQLSQALDDFLDHFLGVRKKHHRVGSSNSMPPVPDLIALTKSMAKSGLFSKHSR